MKGPKLQGFCDWERQEAWLLCVMQLWLTRSLDLPFPARCPIQLFFHTLKLSVSHDYQRKGHLLSNLSILLYLHSHHPCPSYCMALLEPDDLENFVPTADRGIFLKCKYDHGRFLFEIAIALTIESTCLAVFSQAAPAPTPAQPPVLQPFQLLFRCLSMPHSSQSLGLCTDVPSIWNIPCSPSPHLLFTQLPPTPHSSLPITTKVTS